MATNNEVSMRITRVANGWVITPGGSQAVADLTFVATTADEVAKLARDFAEVTDAKIGQEPRSDA